jgi:hypothetical protein
VDVIVDMLSSRAAHLLARIDGPLHFRLFIMPTVVTLIAIRAGVRDAREGRSPFLSNLLRNPRTAFRSAIGDIGRVFLMAIVLDVTYQLIVLRWVYPGEVLLVALVCAVLPYVVVRGPASRLVGRLPRTAPASSRS